MLSINTNLSSLIAQNSLTTSTNKLNQAIERMTTGFKINHAKDNAANYSIATNLTTKIGAYMVAEDNCAMGLDMLATANGSLDQISDKLSRLRILAEQASNGTYGEQSLKAINAEANALVDEINRLYSTAEYNSMKLFEQETQTPDDPNIPKAQYNGFINEVVKRDTSTMTTLASVDPNTALVDGTYSISTPEEMKKLADMTNAGLVSTGDEFVLANDIDLSQYENWTSIGLTYYDNGIKGNPFVGKFDGNGYVISNLRMTEHQEKNYAGLFAIAGNIDIGLKSEIKNLGIKNVDINLRDNEQVGALVGMANYCNITNCYVEGGDLVSNEYGVGGLAGNLQPWSTIDSCYTDLNIIGKEAVGGITGCINSTIKNSFSLSKVSASTRTEAGGIAGKYYHTTRAKIINSYVDARNVDGGIFVGAEGGSSYILDITDCSYSTLDLAQPLVYGTSTNLTTSNITQYNAEQKRVNLQVGINSGSSSSIELNSSFKLLGVEYLRNIGTDVNTDFLTRLDDLLKNVNSKQTELGAVENRLESALDEISTQYENLVSTRSTIRDADIAEVSSEYIRQQILQQASATLMSTANQSPSIALQLI